MIRNNRTEELRPQLAKLIAKPFCDSAIQMTRDYSCKSDGVSIHSTALQDQEIAVEVASRASYTANRLEYTWVSEKGHPLLRLESAFWIMISV